MILKFILRKRLVFIPTHTTILDVDQQLDLGPLRKPTALNQHSTKLELFEKDLEQNTEFRIKYPRGDLGQSSGEAELFMLIEHLAGVLEDVEKEVKETRHNAVNIEFLKEQVKKLNEDVEKLIRNGGNQ